MKRSNVFVITLFSLKVKIRYKNHILWVFSKTVRSRETHSR